MATMTREGVTLPAVKCSVCSAEVEISRMGDHVCGPDGPKSALSLSLPRNKRKTQLLTPIRKIISAVVAGGKTPSS